MARFINFLLSFVIVSKVKVGKIRKSRYSKLKQLYQEQNKVIIKNKLYQEPIIGSSHAKNTEAFPRFPLGKALLRNTWFYPYFCVSLSFLEIESSLL